MADSKPQSGDALHQLITDVFAANPDTIRCEHAERLIALVVDQHLDEEEARSRYPDLFSHMETCPTCASIYRMVTDYTQLEAGGDLPSPPKVPPMPAKLRQTKGGLLSNVIRVLFPGFGPAAPSPQLRGRSKSTPVTVTLDDDLQIELAVETSSASAELRTLYCVFAYQGTAGGTDILNVSATLEREPTGEVEQTQDAQLSRGVQFLDIEPELYRLQLAIGGKDYLIEQIDIL
jgi:hypothetical protein